MSDSERQSAVTVPASPSESGEGFRTVLVVLALAAGFAFIPKLTNGCGAPEMSEDAPDFASRIVANAPTPAQPIVKLSDLRGHPIILDFWATWCGPCQAEAPIVNSLSQRFRDQGLVVIGVNTSDERGLAERFATRKGLTFPIVFDEGNDVARKYKVENLPTLFVISKEGKVVAVRHGITSDADLERLVKKVL
jgi:thiol-disulfide isomerase/thioredoxin